MFLREGLSDNLELTFTPVDILVEFADLGHSTTQSFGFPAYFFIATDRRNQPPAYVTSQSPAVARSRSPEYSREAARASARPNFRKSAGMTIMLRNVDVKMPPRITTAIGC